MMMARLATMLAPSTEYVPLMVNAMNSLASAFCILFMFWTVTHLGRRIYSAQGRELTDANMWTVLGAGAVGALAYTFTDTFWFSAYEGEVYALSSMFTAPRGVAHAQMGRPGRRTPRDEVADPDRLPHGTLDRHSHPQSADRSGTGLPSTISANTRP